MPKLAVLVKEVKKFVLDPRVSDEEFLNAFIHSYVVAGNITNKSGDELYLDKAATSLLLNQKADVHQQLRKALQQYGIREKTERGMSDFVEDYINPTRMQELKNVLQAMILKDDAINMEDQRKLTDMMSEDISVVLADLLILSFSECNRQELKRTLIWKRGCNIAEVITGDLFRFGFDNRKKDRKNIVVIPVNTAFDTHVSCKLECEPKPIVSENTIHGQWLKRMKQSDIDMVQLDIRIIDSLKNFGYEPIACDKGRNGKTDQYAIGSCALIETVNAYYILVAVSEFDKMNNAKSDPEMIECAIKSLLQIYDKYGQGYDMYMPLIGTGRSRAGLSIIEAYKLMTNILVQNAQQIHGHIYIVLQPEDRDEINKQEE